MARQRRRHRRPAKLWWSAVVTALCAAAGSLLWGAFFLTSDQDESWTAWAFKASAGVLLASYLIEPMIRHFQTGRPPNFHLQVRSAKVAFRGVLGTITGALLTDAYSEGIIKSFDSIGEWGATSLIVGLITYAWLRAIGAPYNEASNRAEWLGVLGALGFTLIGAAVDVVSNQPR